MCNNIPAPLQVRAKAAKGDPSTEALLRTSPVSKSTRIRTVFSRHRVEPARNLNVSVDVAFALPRSVHLYPVPEDIVLIVPDYRGYDYIMLDDNRAAIVDPDTFEVVDIIEIA